MACRLVGTKPLPVPVLEIANCIIRKKHRPNLNRYWYRENVFEHVVCEMVVILSQNANRLEYWSWNHKHVPLSRYALRYHGALRSMLISLHRWRYLCWSYFMKINFFGNFFIGKMLILNSLAPVRLNWIFRWAILKLMLVNVGWSISCEIDLRWISLDLTVSMEGNGLGPSGNPFWISIAFCNGYHKN